jgi:DNA invertase Pin-like site-specific DNA recombinase
MLTIRKGGARDQGELRTKRAVIYLRGRGKDEAGIVNVPSVSAQRRACRKAAKALDAEVVGEFVDAPDTPLPRPGIEQVVEVASKRPQLNYLIVYSLDRLGSDFDDVVDITRHLWSLHTVIVPADAKHAFPVTGPEPE